MASAVDLTSSPRSARPVRNLSASWSHIAAASPSDPISSRDSSERSSQKSPPDSQSPPPLESSDHVVEGNAAAGASRGKKTVWNVPSSSSIEGGAVMDAEYWPALSESARVSPKPSPSSSDSLKGDASVSVHVGSVSPTSNPPASSAPSASLNSSLSSSLRNKIVKHVAAEAVSDRSGVPNGGPAASSPLASLSHISQPVPDRQASPKGLTSRNSSNSNHSWDNSSRVVGASNQPHGGNEHHRSYGGGRRGNNGQHSNYGNRRDHERGSYEWNHRNFVRDVHMQQMHPQWGVRPFSRPTPVAAQLIHPPPPPRPFSHNMGFHDMPSTIYYVPAPPHPDALRALPFGPPPAPFPAPPMMFFDPQRAMLLKQIDYYFSPENLCKDTYLRNYMDEQGWVHISVIAGFNRVKQLTNNVQYILDTLRLSTVVEVQGDKIRRRNDWSAWVFAATGNQSGSSGSQSPTATANYDALAAQFHNIGLENSSDQSSYERIC